MLTHEHSIHELVSAAFPFDDVDSIVALPGGRTNAMYRLRLSRHGDAVVRIYSGDAALGRRECDLIGRLRGKVPVPEIIFADLNAEPHPYVIYRYVNGITLRQLRGERDPRAMQEAAHSVGAALAAVGRCEATTEHAFRPDKNLPGIERARFDDYVLRCASSDPFVERIHDATIGRLLRTVDAWMPRIAELTVAGPLVHGDFSRSNILVRRGTQRWEVAAVLDWEFACSGSPMFDVAHFLRYESEREPLVEPYFSDGFVQAGGVLPPQWRRLARVADLAAISRGLAQPHLAASAATELAALLRATLEECEAP